MAIRITRVYTRSGDDGTTGLIGGVRVPKDHPRVETYGQIDELITALGLCRTALASDKKFPARDKRQLETHLREIQNRLFDLGSVLSTPDGKSWADMPLPGAESVTALEKSMDAMQKSLQPLNSFVLPGGSWLNAWFHQCRVLCRKAERTAIALGRKEAVPPEALRYLNRLSDWFFVAARFAAKRSGVKEFLWEFPLKKSVKPKAGPRPAP